MSLTVKDKPYIIPEYSVTGDILSFLKCGLQYRYQNKGELPPSKPVQLWFGEFIHGVMEEAYLRWSTWDDVPNFPWDWSTYIREIELAVSTRLAAGGLRALRGIFCPFREANDLNGPCKDSNHPHKWIASKRAERAINIIGPHLFPLISEPEVKLKGTRPMPNFNAGTSRSNYYGISGVIDVLASLKLRTADSENIIIKLLNETDEGIKIMTDLEGGGFEVIIDYKGMNRPAINDPEWGHHKDQVLDYAWLRAKQSDSKPVKLGILIYINELAPSKNDLRELKALFLDKSKASEIDVLPVSDDLDKILKWNPKENVPKFSESFRVRRAVRILPIKGELFNESINRADSVVSQIESSIFSETNGVLITEAWAMTGDVKTCTVCDFKTFCPDSKDKRPPTI